jgi:hypothetical protein
MLSYEKYLLIAHFHQDGLIRSDLVNLIKLFNKSFNQIIFVSTNLKNSEKKKIDKFAKIITRPNYGYDFYSWKVGLNYLKKKLGYEFNEKKILFLIPSSLLYLKPHKLLGQFNKIKKFKNRVYGLAKSWEVCEHLQSDLFIFSLELLKQKKFYNWWNNIKKFRSRQVIIHKYEIGFSKFLDYQKISRFPIFYDNVWDYPSNIFKLIKMRLLNTFFNTRKIYKKNPTHFYWRNIFKKFGIIKIELVKSNPHNVSLTGFDKIFKNRLFKNLKIEALNN